MWPPSRRCATWRCAISMWPDRTPAAQIGHSTIGSHLLTKVACEAMVGKRPHVSVFGSDYPTPDGTGVRDYLHIEDLAAAHLNALEYLRSGGESTILNVGYGHGYSVREVLRMLEQVAGKPLEHPRRIPSPRRSGLPGGPRRARAQRTGVAAAVRRSFSHCVEFPRLGAQIA